MAQAQTKSKLVVSIVVSLVIFLTAPLVVSAATLSIGASKVNVAPNETFSAAIVVNTQSKTINNVEATITFPASLVEVTGVTAGSVLSVWVEAPTFSNGSGTISFNGGSPNPGFSGSGTVANVQFRAKQAGTATLAFSSAFVRENDGFGTNILSGRSGASIAIATTAPTPTEPSQPVEPTTPTSPGRVNISSTTHPSADNWYNANSATFRWAIPAGATASRTSIDASPSGIPTVQRTPAINSITIPNLSDGTSYFHVRFLINGTWSPISTFRIQVDTVAPTNLQIAGSLDESGRSILNLSADDASSGVEYFIVKKADGTEERIDAVENKASTVILGASGEAENYEISAFDRAGNQTTATLSATVPKAENIEITTFTEKIKVGEEVLISGFTPDVNTEYSVYFQSSSGSIWSYKQTSSDDRSFNFISEPIAKAGEYLVWIEVVEVDGKVIKSDVQRVQVTEGWFGSLSAKINQALGYATWQRLSFVTLAIIAVFGWYKYLLLSRSLAVPTSAATVQPTARTRRPRTKKSE